MMSHLENFQATHSKCALKVVKWQIQLCIFLLKEHL